MIMPDFVIQNGKVLDPDTGLFIIRDIAVENGIITASGDDAKESSYVIDAAGLLVVPGLIDFHAHVFYGGSGFGIAPDWLIPTGVTTVVDAGSSGCANFEAFFRSVCVTSTVRVKAQINLYSAGQPAYNLMEDYTAGFIQQKKIEKLFRQYPDCLIGLKIRLGEEVVGSRGIEPLKEALEFAKEINRPLVVHASNPPCSASEIADLLRPGDVFCHCFHGKGRTILESNGRVQAGVKNAQKRGIVFDSCNGISNFNLDVARKAIADGFFPDIISTDAAPNVFNKRGFAKSLPYIMSKYMDLGMPPERIMKAVTYTPAAHIGLYPGIGTLLPGAAADIALFSIEQAAPEYQDNQGTIYRGSKVFKPQMVIKDGDILFSQIDFQP
jgi:predicted amidohydrolase